MGGLSPWMLDAFQYVTALNFDTKLMAEFKQSIVSYFQALFDWDSVFLATTASEALLVGLNTAIRQAGDEVILLDNGFDTYPGLISTCNGVPVFARRGEDGRLNVEEIARCLTSRTRVVLVTQPENPTGQIHSRGSLQELMTLCAAHHLVLVVDCAFLELSPWDLEIPLVTKLSPPSDLDVIVVGDTGKIVSHGGLRLGTLAVTPRLVDRAVERFADLFFRLDFIRLGFLATVLQDSRLADHK